MAKKANLRSKVFCNFLRKNLTGFYNKGNFAAAIVQNNPLKVSNNGKNYKYHYLYG